ncbi:MAG TPA: hypothetical protein VMX54_04495 [Vicinamibacteria bacterium]|nr:hypothetical protein [Vicinamibacteria bacterium]
MPKKADIVSEYLRAIGSRGGSAGTGESKVRGTSDYYRKLARKRKPKKKGGDKP